MLPQTPSHKTSIEDALERNKALARAAIEIWSTGDFSRVLEIFTPDYVMHQHHDATVGGTGDLTNIP